MGAAGAAVGFGGAAKRRLDARVARLWLVASARERGVDALADAPLLPAVEEDDADHQQDAGDDETELKRAH